MRSCPVFLNNFDKIDADQSCFFYFEKMMPSCPDFFVINSVIDESYDSESEP